MPEHNAATVWRSVSCLGYIMSQVCVTLTWHILAPASNSVAQSISWDILPLYALELLHSAELISDTGASIRNREPGSKSKTKQVSYSSRPFLSEQIVPRKDFTTIIFYVLTFGAIQWTALYKCIRIIHSCIYRQCQGCSHRISKILISPPFVVEPKYVTQLFSGSVMFRPALGRHTGLILLEAAKGKCSVLVWTEKTLMLHSSEYLGFYL